MLFIDTRYLLHKTTPFLFGWLGDRLLGDPEGWPHPIVWFGKAIAYGEKHLNRGNDRILKGGILAVTLIAGIYFLTYGMLYFAGVIHPVISSDVIPLTFLLKKSEQPPLKLWLRI